MYKSPDTWSNDGHQVIKATEFFNLLFKIKTTNILFTVYDIFLK